MKDFKALRPIDYLSILWKRRWYLLISFVLVSGGAMLYSRLIPDVFRSEARIKVEPASIPRDLVRPSDISSPAEQIAEIRQQVQSRSFSERIIQDLNLGGGTGDSMARGLSKSIQIVSTSKNTFTISFSARTAQDAQTITRAIVETLKQSGSKSRKDRAVQADQFLDEQLIEIGQSLTAQEEKIKKFKLDHLGELPEQSVANINALSGLNTQLGAIENTLQHARDQQKLLDFRAQEQKRLNVLTSNVLKPARTVSSEKPETIKTTIPPINPLLKAKQEELSALLSKYTSSHPDVVRVSREVEDLKRQSASDASAINGAEMTALGSAEKKPDPVEVQDPVIESDTLLEAESSEIKLGMESVKNEISKREKEREAVLGQIKVYQQRLNLAPALEQEFLGLSRMRDALAQQYANLQNKKFQAQMTANLESGRTNDVYTVIDEPSLPEKPVFPDRNNIILMGLGAGLAVGIGIAFLREFWDTSLSGENEAAATLKLPVLASILEIPERKPRRLAGYLRTQKSA